MFPNVISAPTLLKKTTVNRDNLKPVYTIFIKVFKYDLFKIIDCFNDFNIRVFLN